GCSLHRGQQTIGNADAKHEIGGRVAEGALAVALGIQPPPTQSGVEIGRRERADAASHRGEQPRKLFPGVLFALYALVLLQCGFHEEGRDQSTGTWGASQSSAPSGAGCAFRNSAMA